MCLRSLEWAPIITLAPVSIVVFNGLALLKNMPHADQVEARKLMTIKKSVAATLASVALSLLGCSAGEEVSETIASRIRAPNLKEFRLTDATKFDWEKVYFFGPYMPRAEVCKRLAVQQKDCDSVVSFESVDDGVISLAFISGTGAIRYVRHKRINGDFFPLPKDQPISAAKAVFRIIPDGTTADGATTWKRLELSDAN